MNYTKLPSYIKPADYQDKDRLLMFLSEHPEDALLLNQMLMWACFIKEEEEQCIKSADYVLSNTKDKSILSEAYELKGTTLQDLKKYDEAIEHLKKAFELDHEAEQVLYKIASCYMGKHQYDEALEYYFKQEEAQKKMAEEFEEPYEEDELLLSNIAEAYFSKKDFESAQKYYQKAVDLNASVENLCGLGRATASMGDNDKALEYFNEALKVDPNDPYIFYYLGQAWQYKNDFYRAMHYYTEALKLKPNFAWVYNNIAGLYYTEEADIKAAIENMMKAIEQAKTDDQGFLITVYTNLARLYNRIADYEQAEYYKAKVFEAIGFEIDWEDGDEDDEDGMEETE